MIAAKDLTAGIALNRISPEAVKRLDKDLELREQLIVENWKGPISPRRTTRAAKFSSLDFPAEICEIISDES